MTASLPSRLDRALAVVEAAREVHEAWKLHMKYPGRVFAFFKMDSLGDALRAYDRSHAAAGGGEKYVPKVGDVPKDQRGLYGKFRVERTDGRSAPGEKHHDCPYFVLDLRHDPHANPAIVAYAKSCRTCGFDALADDLERLRRTNPFEREIIPTSPLAHGLAGEAKCSTDSPNAADAPQNASDDGESRRELCERDGGAHAASTSRRGDAGLRESEPAHDRDAAGRGEAVDVASPPVGRAAGDRVRADALAGAESHRGHPDALPVERGSLDGGAEGARDASDGHRVDRRPAVATDGARDASAASPAPSPSKPAGERPRRIRIVEVSPPSRLTKGGEYEVLGWVGESPSVQFDDGREDFLTESKWEPSPSPREVEIPEEVKRAIDALTDASIRYGEATHLDEAQRWALQQNVRNCDEALVSSIRTALAAARGGK